MSAYWKSYENSNEIAETDPPKYTVKIIVDRNGVESITPINFGQSVNVHSNANDIIKVVVDIKAGYKIDKITIDGTGIYTYSTSPVENLKEGVEILASGMNVVQVDYSESGEPIEPDPILRDFLIYNVKNWIGVKVWEGDTSITAKVRTVSLLGKTVETNLILGDESKSKVNMAGLSSAELIISPLDGFKIRSAYVDYLRKEVLPVDGKINYFLTNDEITKGWGGLRQYKLDVVDDTPPINPDEKRVLIYNSIIDGIKSWVGDSDLKVSIELWGEYDFVTQTYPHKKTDLVLGEKTLVYWDNWDNISSCNIIAQALDGTMITKFKVDFNDSEPFTVPRESLKYEYPEAQFNELRTLGSSFLFTISKDTPPPIKDAISNQYLLSDSEFTTFKSEYLGVLAGQSVTKEPVLISDFLQSVKLYPFSIPNINQGDSDTQIEIQTFKLKSKGTVLLSDVINLNMGIIEVPRIYNNSLDFMGSTVDLYLPFMAGNISINPLYIIGNSVEIVCNIVIETGDMTINLVNVSTQEIYNISKGNVGLDYPFFKTSSGGSLFNPSQAINDIRKAYVIVNVPDYSETTPMAEVKEVISGNKGFIQVSKISLNSVAFRDEKENLLNLLNQGVFIK